MGGGNQWASLLFGDKQVQESSSVICSVIYLLHICVLAGRDFEVFLQHMSISGLCPLIVVLLRLNNLKAKLSVEVNCRLIADLDMQIDVVKSAIFFIFFIIFPRCLRHDLTFLVPIPSLRYGARHPSVMM